MKSILSMALCIFMLTACNAQSQTADGKKAVSLLKGLSNQYSNKISLGNSETIIILSVPVTNNPFKVYDSLKTVTLKDNVFLVGGFKNPGGHGAGMPADHLRSGFVGRYGKSFLPVFLDSESEVSAALALGGHGIVELNVKTGKISKSTDYRNKVDDFIKALKAYKK